MMFEHVRCAKDVAVDGGSLFDDACVRNSHDNALLPVPYRMVEGEGKARQCLSAAGRNGQAEEAGGQCGCAATIGQHLGPEAIDWGVAPESGKVRIQSVAQDADAIVSAATIKSAGS